MVGDVFAMMPPDGQYLFGRVAATDADPLGVGGAILIYIYRVRAAEKKPVPSLLRGQMLTAPMMTNKQPWTKGYFETVEQRTMTPMEKMPQHCFLDTRGWHFDEYGKRLDGPVGLVGQWGLHSYRTIDDEISLALGIPLADDS